MRKAEVGIIGGSGLYQMDSLKGRREVRLRTPYGRPSDAFILGKWEGTSVVFLARHGRGHRLLPAEINFRANIWGMKELGVSRIISVSAVGSMKEKLKPGHVVVPDQFFDHTRRRESTFFGSGLVGHVSLAQPVCPSLAQVLLQAGRGTGAVIHEGGVYLCIEGPQFSSLGESLIYRQWGVDVIGMTNVTEAKLAREAEICYATLALVTDYDCWHQEMESVTVEGVLEILHKNVALSQNIIRNAIPKISDVRDCQCATALQNAVITSPDVIPAGASRKLKWIARYLPPGRKKKGTRSMKRTRK
jgi:5'-methylthioadenosine phosphorylase